MDDHANDHGIGLCSLRHEIGDLTHFLAGGAKNSTVYKVTKKIELFEVLIHLLPDSLDDFLILYNDFAEGCQRESMRALRKYFALSDYADFKKRFHTCLPAGRCVIRDFCSFSEIS